MRVARTACVALCLLCLTTQSGCKGLKVLAGLVKSLAQTHADDLVSAGRLSRGAAKTGDDIVTSLGSKAAKGAAKWGFKQLKAAMSTAETSTAQAQAVLSRTAPHVASRSMAFLQLRYEQNLAALNTEFSQLTDDMSDSQTAAAQKRIDRIAREQAAIASLAERME